MYDGKHKSPPMNSFNICGNMRSEFIQQQCDDVRKALVNPGANFPSSIASVNQIFDIIACPFDNPSLLALLDESGANEGPALKKSSSLPTIDLRTFQQLSHRVRNRLVVNLGTHRFCFCF